MYEMCSEAGNRAVHSALQVIRIAASHRQIINNRDTLQQYARPLILGIGYSHPEVTDTEPRAHIYDALDTICRENGWTYNERESYDF